MNISVQEAKEDPNIKSIKIIFEPYSNGHSPNAQKEYTYKTRLDIRIGDFVIVESQDQFKVVHVVDVCEKASHFDKNAKFEYQWAFQKVDVKMKQRLDQRTQLFSDLKWS